ncbi:MAG: hypothetical protein IJR59_01680 [Firmicutes bacterium]|nr:hypothetical protein [Bacillota bacterium]
MRALPIIRSEFKRSAWVVFAALAVVIPACVGITLREIQQSAYYAAMYTDSEFYVTSSIFDPLCTFSVLWAALLVYVQYINDCPDFSRALPYTTKQLILSRSVTAVFIAAAVSAVYALFMLGIASRYSWLINTASWSAAEISEDRFDTDFVLISAAAAFLLSVAVYWYISLCCCVSKHIFAGFALAFLGFSTFCGLMNLSNYIKGKGIEETFKTLLAPLSLDNYTMSIIILLFALVLLLLTLPAALKLYGGGNSTHPFFGYSAAGKTAAIFTVLTFAFFAPEFLNMQDNIPLALLIGGTIGAAAAAAANKLIVKRCAK